MTRPNIMRADTLDLQDHDNPSAAEHAKHPTPTNGNAPNVAAQVHQVLEERHSEEQALADAWNITDNLTNDPAAINHAQADNVDAHVITASAHNGGTNGHDVEQEVDADDDMMDRISSSPSIDDGGLSPYSSYQHDKLWTRRHTSLSPIGESFNQTAYPTPESSPLQPVDGSNEPGHSPLARATDGERVTQSFAQKPLLKEDSPFPASKHHQSGRYGLVESDRDSKDMASNPGLNEDVKVNEGVLRNRSFIRSLLDLGQMSLQPSPSSDSYDSVDLEALLLPAHDPYLEGRLSPTHSWESMSETNSDHSDEATGRAIDDDDANGAFLDHDDRFVDSGWGGERLRATEDIDFEFVYALHTFVATVEGQANATKGDTMVLLDDSNSYWWLVRVVKDSSIGYLPAEHIETPTERLARLNKHRNIDLSATMLSDNSEKSRNPLKKAMRRRNAKTVQFAAPTYVEASDYDYSTEDEDQMVDPYGTALQVDDITQAEPDTARQEMKAETQESNAEVRTSTSSQRASFDREQAAAAARALEAAGIHGEDYTAPIAVKEEAAPIKTGSSKKRNTDSWTKDDSIETRKITLTPGLLREESLALNNRPPDSPRSNSLESLQKTTSPTDPPKKEAKETKKKESKKSGGIMNLFKSKKKDKKTKDDGNEADTEKTSGETPRDSSKVSPMTSGRTSPVEKPANAQGVMPRGNLHHVVSAEELRDSNLGPNQEFIAELPGHEVAQELATPQDEINAELQHRPDNEAGQTEKPKSSNPLSPITNPITSILKTGEDKPKKAKRSKQRVELDDFDSPQEEAKNPFSDPQEDEDKDGSLSDSPVEITSHAFMHGTDTIHIPVFGEGETDENDVEDGPGSLTSSPSIIEHPAEPLEEEGDLAEDSDPTPTARSPQPPEERSKSTMTPSRGLSTDSTTSSSQHLSPRPSPSTVSQQAWSDESLRAWLEDGSEVRDMLVMINDKTGVTPAPADHPLMAGLFVEQRKGVQDMMGQLDSLLGGYLQRKGVRF